MQYLIVFMKEFVCQFKIKQLRFKKPDDGFFIAQASVLPKDLLTIRNAFPAFEPKKFSVKGYNHEIVEAETLDPDMVYEMVGELSENQYGITLSGDYVNEVIPEDDVRGLVSFLKKNIDFIGEKRAQAIAKKYSTATAIKDLFENPANKNALLSLAKVGEAKYEAMMASWHKSQLFFKIQTYLRSIKIAKYNEWANKLMRRFPKHMHSKIIQEIRLRPYALITRGFDLKSMDYLRDHLVKHDEQLTINDRLYAGLEFARKCATVLFAIRNLMKTTGDTLFQEDSIVAIAAKLGQYDAEEMARIVELLIDRGKLVVFDGLITDVLQYGLERRVAERIFALTEQPYIPPFSRDDYEWFEKHYKDKLDESQFDACMTIFRSRFSTLTGGPGFGKTHTLQAVHAMFKHAKKKLLPVAPTGKASERMSQSMGVEAKTLHRELKIKVLGEDSEFEDYYNETETADITAAAVAVDESSMVDLNVGSVLFEHLGNAALIMVGDPDQLPPINAGSLFADIVQYPHVNNAELKKLHRTAQNNRIAVNAFNMKRELPLDLSEDPYDTLEIIDSDAAKERFENIGYSGKDGAILSAVYGIYQNLMEQGVSANDIQVLTPTNKDMLGTHFLNDVLKEIGNPQRASANKRDLGVLDFCVGDKVMQIRNDADNQVYNGNTGKIIDVSYDRVYKTRHYTIEFSDTVVRYSEKDMKNIQLAYAFTIHKSQGSDYPYVIIPLTQSHAFQWTKKLLYTGWTRTKKKLFLVGDMGVIDYALNNDKNTERKTVLSYLLKNRHIAEEVLPF